jgi:release factor glutamine methyltransferase
LAETALALARTAGAFLRDRGFEGGRLEAELLLAGVLGVRRLDLYLQHDRPVGGAELDAFRSAVRRRLRHEPVQYILGETGFRGLRLKVDRRALIPRPETEVLVGAVVSWVGARAAVGAPASRAVDVGTGSGAIGLSLAVETGLAVVATDVSADALSLAGENRERLGLAGRVELRAGRLFEPLGGQRFDVIVSNPPYVAESDRDALAPEIRDWEPSDALFAGASGLAVLEAIVAGAPPHLEAGGLLALEVGAGQARTVAGWLRSGQGWAWTRILPDLTGRERVVLAGREGDDVARDKGTTDGAEGHTGRAGTGTGAHAGADG